MAFLDEIAEYAKIDKSEEDIQSYIDAAETYLTNAGAAKDETNAIYKLAVKLLVTHWHDNRSAVLIGSISKSLEYSLQSIIAQLKYCTASETVTV